MLTNTATKLEAVTNTVCNGMPYSEPSIVAEPTDEPNPDVSDMLSSKVRDIQSQVDTLAQCMSAAKNKG